MRRLASTALISAVIAMSGCAVDSMEDQEEEEPGVETIESEVVNGTVALIVYAYDGVQWYWRIQNTYNNWAYRKVVFVNGGVGYCRAITPNGSFWHNSYVQPWYLIGC